MAQNIGNISLNLGVNTSGFKSQMAGITKTAQKSVSGMSGMFGKLGLAIGAAFSVAAVAKFAKACMDLGSDLAEVQNVVDVTFGEMSGAVNKWAKNAMTSYGLSEKVAKDYMGQLGAMSKAFGNSTEEAYKQAEALAGLTGDVASFYNLTTDEAFSKLKAVYTGETEALKSLGVVMTQTALDEFALAKGFGKTTDKMSEQEKVALRLAFVQDRLASASGDFARTSDGWANQTRVLSLRFDALKASIGQGLIVALLPAVRLLNQLVAWLQIAADEFSNFMQAIFGATGGSSGASSLGESLATGSGALASNMGDAASSAKAIKKTLAGFDQLNILSSDSSGDSGASDVGASVGSSLGSSGSVSTEVTAGASAAEKMKTLLAEVKTKLVEIANVAGLTGFWADFLTGIDNVKAGLGNIASAFKEAVAKNMPALDTYKESIGYAFTSLSQAVTGVWGSMWTTLTENFKLWTSENLPTIQEFFDNIVSIVSEYGTLITTIVGNIYEDALAWWRKGGQPVYDGVIKAIGDIWKWLLDIYNMVIAPVFKKLIETWGNIWEGTLRPLWQNLLGAFSDVGELILALWNNILKPVVDWIVKAFAPHIKAILENIVERFTMTYNSIAKIVNASITGFRGLIQFLTGVFTGDWEKAWGGITKYFTGVWESIKAQAGFFFNPLLHSFECFLNNIISGLNWLIKQINKISFEVPDWVPGIGGKKMGFNVKQVSEVSLPRLATGGYVEANTPQLAIVGDNKREGEIIAPESKIAEAVAHGFAMAMSKITNGNTGNKQPIYLTIKLGESDFWQGFVDYHNSVVKSTGETPLLI